MFVPGDELFWFHQASQILKLLFEILILFFSNLNSNSKTQIVNAAVAYLTLMDTSTTEYKLRAKAQYS